MLDILKSNKLFAGMEEAEIPELLKCLGYRKVSRKKGEFIFLAGQSRPKVAILLSGKAQVVKENVLGDRMVIGALEPGDMFGETFACMEMELMPVSVVALADSSALMLDVGRIVSPCQVACGYHRQLISNLLKIIAEKNVQLNRQMSFISHKTIRSRLEAYFYDMMEREGSRKFEIPFSLSKLANYLCIDRSAMSRELSRMREEGLLDYRGRRFIWLDR
ncbi:MAG: Crp/Fnr family transcriptional regulator [Oscillospiraceae bacterium]|jgi:CRP-like cAMP-binding protein